MPKTSRNEIGRALARDHQRASTLCTSSTLAVCRYQRHVTAAATIALCCIMCRKACVCYSLGSHSLTGNEGDTASRVQMFTDTLLHAHNVNVYVYVYDYLYM